MILPLLWPMACYLFSELVAGSQKLEAGYNRPLRNEKGLYNQRRNDLSFNSQQDERMSGV